jgi:hypothetical protein
MDHRADGATFFKKMFHCVSTGLTSRADYQNRLRAHPFISSGDGCKHSPVVEHLLAGPATAVSGRASTGTVNDSLDRARTLFREMQAKGVCFGTFADYGELLEQLGKLLFQQ